MGQEEGGGRRGQESARAGPRRESDHAGRGVGGGESMIPAG